MTSIKAKIEGQWVTISGDNGQNAAGAAHWNNAWGMIGEARWASTWTSVSTTAATITASSGVNTFSAYLYASRRYRLYWQGMVASTAGGDYVVLQHQVNGSLLGENNAQYIAAANVQVFSWVESRYIPAADGMYTFSMTGRRSSAATGTVSVVNTGNNPLWLMIEDLGPITSVAISPPAGQPRIVAAGNALGIITMGSFIPPLAPHVVPVNATTALTNPLGLTAVVGRRYRIHLQIRAIAPTSGTGIGNLSFWLRDNGVEVRSYALGGDPYAFSDHGYTAGVFDWLVEGDGASHSYEVVCGGTASNVYTDFGLYYIEDVGPNTLPALPIPETPTPWTQMTLQNAWLYYGAPYTIPAYRKVGDKVEIRGLLRAGTTSTIVATLPAGFRPPYTHHFAAVGNDAVATIRIDTGGVIVPAGTQVTNWVSMDGISFSTTS